MAVTAPEKLVRELNELIELDYDAINAYDTAIDRLDDPSTQDQLRSFRDDHERHTRELARCVRDLGGTPSDSGSMRSVLTQGKVVIGNLRGDKGILQAMRSNEEQTNQAYEQAVQNPDVSGYNEVREVLQRGLSDERRHRAWIVDRLERMKAV